MNFDAAKYVEYDSVLGAYTLCWKGEVILLGSETYLDAGIEAANIVVNWQE